MVMRTKGEGDGSKWKMSRVCFIRRKTTVNMPKHSPKSSDDLMGSNWFYLYVSGTEQQSQKCISPVDGQFDSVWMLDSLRALGGSSIFSGLFGLYILFVNYQYTYTLLYQCLTICRS